MLGGIVILTSCRMEPSNLTAGTYTIMKEVETVKKLLGIIAILFGVMALTIATALPAFANSGDHQNGASAGAQGGDGDNNDDDNNGGNNDNDGNN